ncbi:MAG: DEAD/DEAH box helicase family protein [Clostridiales bacterium]|nr:DEAD/DEAH box helicase family protein [Clostridiales bacterium]
MGSVKEKLDDIEKRIMDGLKDFQRETVERIALLYKDKVNRVLVSDEVGLGKTLIARGTIAKFAKIRREEGDNLVKVVYVCSNAAIAEQNLNKLKITDELMTEGVSSSRLSMQHLNICKQESREDVQNRYIQLIPLTPDTSFRMTSGTGTVNERALMLAVLKHLPEFEDFESELDSVMIDGVKRSNWDWVKYGHRDGKKRAVWFGYEGEVRKCEDASHGEYLTFMKNGLRRELSQKQNSGATYFDDMFAVFDKIKTGQDYKWEAKRIIGQLRLIFAKLSLEKLEPDLVIMDEFQRFKFLISSDPESETGMLANKFFSDENTRMLLLSATPYKMYSTLDEIDEENADEHYEEFLRVLKFLNMTDEADREFRRIWSDYSVQLKEYASGNQAVLQIKAAAENALYSHICRTERMEAEGAADMVDDSTVEIPLEVGAADIDSYIQMSKLLGGIAKYAVPSDYVKSCPYLLSFMRDYKLKRDVESYFKTHPDEVGKLNHQTFFIKRKDLAEYKEIPCNNARLQSVAARVLSDNAELLLWVPPSKCYYRPLPPFDAAQNFTKTLIFSSWEMVPRMLASLLSYEVERRTIAPLAKREGKDIRYFTNDTNDDSEEGSKRHYPPPKLNFTLKEGEPAAMSLFCLIYPSRFLAKCYEPIKCMNMPTEEITREVKNKIAEALSDYGDAESGAEDKSWYYVAPLLLDGCGFASDYAKAMIESIVNDIEEQDKKSYIEYFYKLESVCEKIKSGSIVLGKRPADLLNVLADMAIASPAVCAYRAYSRRFDRFDITYPTQIAKAFANRMKTPESTAVIELCFGVKNDDAYWKNVLAYCKAGNFQAMLDEYIHLIASGVSGRGERACEVIQKNIIGSLSIRTTKYNIDTLGDFTARINGEKDKKISFRSHFAVAFTKGDGGEKDSDRKKVLRNAFNSPFRPFVLASTSIGQEGLDFHNYCRRIVHWNLPSNPIDLEQREGRINRYECLAIRQNVAKRYGDIEFEDDVWHEMFEKARETECTVQTSELVPYWGLTERPDMIKIERIVPMYPFSRDELSYNRLMKILSLYRLTLGQARQEEVLEYIMENRTAADLKEWFINLSPYYKRRNDTNE